MLALSHADFLTLWESGHRLHPLDRGLLALRASLSDAAGASVADWPLGRRNQAFAKLRTLCFGPRLQGWLSCSQCREKLEFEVDCRTLVERGEERMGKHHESIVVDGRAYRLPTSRDLARIANEADPQRAAQLLLKECRIEADEAGTDDSPSPITLEELDRVSDQMALADPLAEIALGFECPNCKSATEEILDLGCFFWSEIEARARHLLLEIHALASAYGWAESQILAMSDVRRTAYLQMVLG